MRDDFPQSVKRILADRVAWKCCFPGCRETTIGPGNNDDKHVLRLGVAAHITAAAPGGPRYDERLKPEERSSIHNAIWLCLKHGQLIDQDYSEYSPETLRQWKAQAEVTAHKNLLATGETDDHLTTFISIGPSIICEAKWQTISANTWTFQVSNFIQGNWDQLFQYSMNFDSINALDKYLIFERQGDGRVLQHIELVSKASQPEIIFTVKDKFPSTDPNETGADIDANFGFEDGDLKLVKGMDAAHQAVWLTLSSAFGHWKEHPGTGSFFVEYYKAYKDRSELLNRLLKIEITRLLSIPVNGGYPPTFQPLLPFMKRVLSVTIQEVDEATERISVLVRGEWGNGANFEEVFAVFTGQNDVDFDW